MKQYKRQTDALVKRREEILDVAMKLFAEKGYHNTTLDEVAEALGITKAALYYYVRNKGEIIRAIMNRSIERMNKAIALGESNMSPQARLHEFIRYHVIFAAENKEDARILFEQMNVLPKMTGESIKRKQKMDDRALQKILQEGVEEGSFTISDVKMASYAILGLCNWTYHWYKPDGRLTPEQIAKICIGLLENGYLKKSCLPKEVANNPVN